MVKRVLMIAYHFPPVHGSTGVLRTLKFARYLREHDWEPLVLSVHPRAYERVDDGQLAETAGMTVRRAFALDTRRHLSLGGHYPRSLALPDRWTSWWWGAVPAGWAMIKRYRPAVLWSTFPIATAHKIGLTLHRLSGIPWVADFRDSMTEDHYPEDAIVRRAYRRIEQETIRCSRYATFTAASAVAMYAARYPDVPRDRLRLIENGYDEEDFASLAVERPVRRPGGPLTLLHSGILYPSERDPAPFFDALARMRAGGEIGPDTLRVIFRATAHDDLYGPMLAARELGGIVQLLPAVGYRDALREMMAGDALLLLQAANCNHQIPAKLYEYLRAHRPIIGLTDPAGDTAAALRRAGLTSIAPLDNADAIVALLRDVLPRLRSGTAPLPDEAEVARYSRRSRTAELAYLLDQAVAPS
jgi:hypothetical protein